MKYLLALLAVVMLTSCGFDDVLARADALAHQAAENQAVVEKAIARAEATAAALKQLAATLDSTQAKTIIAQADALVQGAKAELPDAIAFAQKTATALDDAKAARARGDSIINTLLGIASVAIPGGGIWAVLARNTIGTLRTSLDQHKQAIIATAAHADRMENADSDLDLANAKLISAAEQRAAGVADLIQTLRKDPSV